MEHTEEDRELAKLCIKHWKEDILKPLLKAKKRTVNKTAYIDIAAKNCALCRKYNYSCYNCPLCKEGWGCTENDSIYQMVDYFSDSDDAGIFVMGDDDLEEAIHYAKVMIKCLKYIAGLRKTKPVETR